MLRGTAGGLEFVFGGDAFDEAWSEIADRLAERPGFYRGSSATAIFDAVPPEGTFARLAAGAGDYGIALRGVYGPAAVAELAEQHALAYLGEPPRGTPPARGSVANIGRKRAERSGTLTERARSLDADFAGARADIAGRRARGEPSVPKPNFAAARASHAATAAPPAPAAIPAGPATLYHRGTLRGGQALQQLGSIVVVGDVNPGAELVASGDIVVFGALRGTAHAGAQGDVKARVLALELVPTQLRIATLIAGGESGPRAREPEVAFIDGDRIAIVPLEKAGTW